ncbi:MAG: reductive dehalogenase [Planctomycetota bacterium]|nr:MAG: reductive dehalogenase [Planctomycetota bacterium]
MNWLTYVIYVMGTFILEIAAILSVGMLITFIREREWRATGLALAILLPVFAGYSVLLFVDYPGRRWVALALVGISIFAALLLLLPIGRNEPLRVTGEEKRVDERDAVFHRFYRLEEGTPEFEAYYKEHPEKTEFDEAVRALPPLAGPGAKTYGSLSSPFQIASFSIIEEISREIDWEPQPVEESPVKASPEEFSKRVKGFARYLGADLAGCTKLNPAYVYSHIGRSPGKWGELVSLEHENAIALAVEMSYDMVRHAPDSAVTTETAWKYLKVGVVAMTLARYINLLGYEARAHVDGNYRVMCVPVAADAGLGELGRLGLLVTPKFGPRVRLAVVTTNMPLAPDPPVAFGVQDFCTFCKKCATCCPSGSVDKNDKQEYNGAEKWRSEQDTCYRYWRICGSDCGICVKVCPYSKPTTVMHNLIRWLTARNALARRFALIGDDFFFGRKPKTKYSLPEWHGK